MNNKQFKISRVGSPLFTSDCMLLSFPNQHVSTPSFLQRSICLMASETSCCIFINSLRSLCSANPSDSDCSILSPNCSSIALQLSCSDLSIPGPSMSAIHSTYLPNFLCRTMIANLPALVTNSGSGPPSIVLTHSSIQLIPQETLHL